MVMSMSVTDNLEAIRPVRFPLQLYKRHQKQFQIQKYLDEYDMNISAGDPVYHLSRLQQIELSIIKAQMHGVRLIGLDMTENKYGEKETEKICSLIRRVNREGVSFIVFSEDYSIFAEIAGRIQLLSAGKEQKEWSDPWKNPERIRRKLFQDIYDKSMDSVRSGDYAGEGFLGMHDDEWEKETGLWDYFKTVKENNPEIWKQYIDAKLPGDKEWDRGKTAIIPMGIEKMLISNLSLADNIILAVPERVCGSKYGIIKKSIKENIVQGFYRRFQIEESISRVEELDWVYKKILAIYRWELARPEVIFLENPYNGLTGDEKKIMTDYLWELKKKKIRIVLMSRSIESLKEVCGKIMITKNGKSAKITTI